MSDEWNWNDEQVPPVISEEQSEQAAAEEAAKASDIEENAEEKTEQIEQSTDMPEPEVSEVDMSASQMPASDMKEESYTSEAAAAKEEPEQPIQEPGQQESAQTGETPNQQDDTTYHWVNPEYQRRQQNIADTPQNTYENNNYRETGYRGGAYHSGWQNQDQAAGTSYDQTSYGQNANNQTSYERTQTGQRRYGEYQFASEKQEKQPKEKKPMGTGKKFLVAAGMAVMFGVIAGGTMFGVNALGNQLSGQDRIPETQIPSTTVGGTEGEPGDNTGADVPAAGNEASESTPVNASGDFSVAEVANNCMPSVVSITNASVQSVQDFFGGVTQYPSESTGSGIIVGQNDTELLIATNNHVVAGAETLTVAFTDDAVCEAQTKGTAEDSDLAVISVKLDDMTEETLSAIKIVTLGDSDALSVGEQVVAIGNALGYGQSVTSGWVSAVNREVTDSEGNSSGKLIQTDAAINPGNSGGALLNMRGELIGINSAKAAATEVEGMGYAIPISLAQPILDELMNRETRYKASEDKAAYIGVTCMNVDSTAAAAYGIPVGAFVDSVEEGGPAEEVGIMKGDVIVKFDGVAVTGSTDLVSKIEYYEAGESVEVVYSRAENGEYKEHTATVTLGKKSEMKQTTEPNTTNQQ